MVSSTSPVTAPKKIQSSALEGGPFGELMKAIVLTVQQYLGQLGYDVPKTGVIDEATKAAFAKLKDELTKQLGDGVSTAPTGVGTKKAPTEADKKTKPAGTYKPEDLEKLTAKKPALVAETAPGENKGGVRVLTGADGKKVEVSAMLTGKPEAQFAHYEAMIKASGPEAAKAFDAAMAKGQPYVLALRGMEIQPDGKSTKTHETKPDRAMRDTMVVLKKDPRTGEVSVEHMVGSTYPGPEKVGEKSKEKFGLAYNYGVGIVGEGTYRMNWTEKKDGSWWMTTLGGDGRIPGARNSDFQGGYSVDEWKDGASLKKDGHAVQSIMMHAGGAGADGKKGSGGDDTVSSVGCQNVQDFAKFKQQIGAGQSYGYTIINADPTSTEVLAKAK